MKKLILVIFILLISITSYSQTTITFDTPQWELKIIGTEPFWDMELDNNDAEFKLFDNETIKFNKVKQIFVVGMQTEFITTFSLSSKKNFGYLTVKRCDTPCNDGMSENNYAYEIIFILNGKEAYYGVGNMIIDN
ncbi:MAG TPA: hypothetical protein PLG90_01795 [Ignavibacteria bacterium]|nr:hypothetical protein [Ignavibacteria bacterium]